MILLIGQARVTDPHGIGAQPTHRLICNDSPNSMLLLVPVEHIGNCATSLVQLARLDAHRPVRRTERRIHFAIQLEQFNQEFRKSSLAVKKACPNRATFPISTSPLPSLPAVRNEPILDCFPSNGASTNRRAVLRDKLQNRALRFRSRLRTKRPSPR